MADRSARRRVFLLGGGPSLPLHLLPELRPHGAIFAINRAVEAAPFADLLYWADWRFYGWHGPEIDAFRGEKVTTSSQGEYPTDVQRLRWDRVSQFSADPGALAGQCSGGHAINLAALRGFPEIWLLGFDFGAGRWHDGYPHDENHHLRGSKFLPAIERMAPYIAAAGIAVYNANPFSLLRCFPFRDLSELLN